VETQELTCRYQTPGSSTGTAVIDLVGGIAIISLLPGTARSAVQPGRTATPRTAYGAR
jgi:hypothetical protein